jgi:hypothetical protein
MILVKYLIFYSFVGIYQSVLFTKSRIKKTAEYLKSREQKRNQGEVAGFKTTLLQTAFRSIL